MDGIENDVSQKLGKRAKMRGIHRHIHVCTVVFRPIVHVTVEMADLQGTTRRTEARSDEIADDDRKPLSTGSCVQ